jgi:hypothetical protein
LTIPKAQLASLEPALIFHIPGFARGVVAGFAPEFPHDLPDVVLDVGQGLPLDLPDLALDFGQGFAAGFALDSA